MTDAISPFHGGELAIQEKLGVREKVQKYATKMVRPYMPEQHREFFAALPYFFLGTVDEAGMPWAHMVWGNPGFITSPDLEHLTLPAAGMPDGARHVGAEVGGLGLMLQNRRRNRVNGRIVHVTEDRVVLRVTQSFGNCPQYIQAREALAVVQRAGGAVQTALKAPHRRMIESADTFFVASASARLGADARHGVDVSHRGGTPGFVKFLDEKTLLFPDFSGNHHFNTLGNIHDTGRAGLLFVDFDSGDLVQISGAASLIWPEDSGFFYTAAERFVQVSVDQVRVAPAAVPFTWHFHGHWPRLPAGAGWVAKPGQGGAS